MKDAAESYVRVRASGLLLRWVIDRYRKEKQGPLLRRASELFQTIDAEFLRATGHRRTMNAITCS